MSAVRPSNGGAAFPVSGDYEVAGFVNEGMTLRDYFAAAVMPRIYASHVPETSAEERAAMFAVRAYEIADAMLAERQKAAKS